MAAKTAVGSARLQEAQDATGLSNESIARLIPVSEKTWRRWKDAGEIPTAALPAVAKALGLDLRGADGLVRNGDHLRIITTPDSDQPDRLEELAGAVGELLRVQLETRQELELLRAELSTARQELLGRPTRRRPG